MKQVQSCFSVGYYGQQTLVLPAELVGLSFTMTQTHRNIQSIEGK